MSVVVFNPTVFKARYAEFASASSDLLQACFDEACLYLNNTDSSLVTDVTARTLLLNMLTAHITKLSYPYRDAAAVGRLSSAGEGSVNAGLDAGPVTGSQAWYLQTQYGAAFWEASAQYRAAIWVGVPFANRPARTPWGY